MTDVIKLPVEETYSIVARMAETTIYLPQIVRDPSVTMGLGEAEDALRHAVDDFADEYGAEHTGYTNPGDYSHREHQDKDW